MFPGVGNGNIARTSSLSSIFEEFNSSKVGDLVPVMKHEEFTSNVSIPRFCGDPKIITNDARLSPVNNHIINERVTDDPIKVEVLK